MEYKQCSMQLSRTRACSSKAMFSCIESHQVRAREFKKGLRSGQRREKFSLKIFYNQFYSYFKITWQHKSTRQMNNDTIISKKQTLPEKLEFYIEIFYSMRASFVTSIHAYAYSCESVHDLISDVNKSLDPVGHVIKAFISARSLDSSPDCMQNVIFETNWVDSEKKARRSERKYLLNYRNDSAQYTLSHSSISRNV